MLRPGQRKLLSLFGDAKAHHFFEVCKYGSVLLKTSEREVDRRFKSEILENGWVRRLWRSQFFHLDYYILTKKGDRCFRVDQISRLDRISDLASAEMKRHFQHFNRQARGKYGVDGLGGKKITEIDVLNSNFTPEYGTP